MPAPSFLRPAKEVEDAAGPPRLYVNKTIQETTMGATDIHLALPQRAFTAEASRPLARGGRDAETPLKDSSRSGAISSDSWAWVELNYRPHAYQATEGE